MRYYYVTTARHFIGDRGFETWAVQAARRRAAPDEPAPTPTEGSSMWSTRMFRDRAEAQRRIEQLNAQKGAVERNGRMTERLLGCELYERELSGRPAWIVQPVVSVYDPLYDGADHGLRALAEEAR